MGRTVVRFSWGYVPGQSSALRALYPNMLREIERLDLWTGPWIKGGTRNQILNLDLDESDQHYEDFLKPVHKFERKQGPIISWLLSLWSERPDGTADFNVRVAESERQDSSINLVLPYGKERLPPLESLERLVHTAYPSAKMSIVELT